MLSPLSRISSTNPRYTTTTTTLTTTNNPISATNTSHSPVNNEEAENNYQQQLQETLSQIKNDFSSEIQDNWDNNDIGKAYNGIFTALEEHNFVDAINLFQQHSNMKNGTPGFMPRGRYQIFIKLLVSLLPYSKHTESYRNNVKYVFKACVLDLISASALKLIIGMVKDVPEVWNETIVMNNINRDEQISATIDNIEGLLFLKNNCETFSIRRINALIILKLTFDSIQYSNTMLPQEQQNITGINTQPLLDFASKYGADWNDDPDYSLINKEFIDQCTNLFDNPQHKVQLLICYHGLMEYGILKNLGNTIKSHVKLIMKSEAQKNINFSEFNIFELSQLLSIGSDHIAENQKEAILTVIKDRPAKNIFREDTTCRYLSVTMIMVILNSNFVQNQTAIDNNTTESSGSNQVTVTTANQLESNYLIKLTVHQLSNLFQNDEFIQLYKTTHNISKEIEFYDKTQQFLTTQYSPINKYSLNVTTIADFMLFNFIKIHPSITECMRNNSYWSKNLITVLECTNSTENQLKKFNETHLPEPSSQNRKNSRDALGNEINNLIHQLSDLNTTGNEESKQVITLSTDILNNIVSMINLMKKGGLANNAKIIREWYQMSSSYIKLANALANHKNGVSNEEQFVCFHITRVFSLLLAPGSKYNVRFLVKQKSELLNPTLSNITKKKILLAPEKIPAEHGLLYTACFAAWFLFVGNTAENRVYNAIEQSIFKGMLSANDINILNIQYQHIDRTLNSAHQIMFEPIAKFLNISGNIPVDISNVLHVLHQVPLLTFHQFKHGAQDKNVIMHA